MAGASFSIVTNSGTFQGTMAAATPTGSLRTRAEPNRLLRRSVNSYSLARPT